MRIEAGGSVNTSLQDYIIDDLNLILDDLEERIVRLELMFKPEGESFSPRPIEIIIPKLLKEQF